MKSGEQAWKENFGTCELSSAMDVNNWKISEKRSGYLACDAVTVINQKPFIYFVHTERNFSPCLGG